MGVIRNFIDIIGITPENELLNIKDGEIVEYSDHEIIHISNDNLKIESIYQIMLETEFQCTRKINTSHSKIYVLDGVMKLKILYIDKEKKGKINLQNIERPFNTFLDLHQNRCLENIEIFVADAYFKLLDERNIYSYYLFMINVQYDKNKVRNELDTKRFIQDINLKKEQHKEAEELEYYTMSMNSEFL